jgi:hypothetical protein
MIKINRDEQEVGDVTYVVPAMVCVTREVRTHFFRTFSLTVGELPVSCRVMGKGLVGV